MNFLKKFFSDENEPSEKQILRALKQVTQIHGEAAGRVAAMERLASWKTPEAAAALLRRFTVRTPQESMDLEEKQYAVQLLSGMGTAASGPILKFIRSEPDVTYPVQALKSILQPEEFRKSLADLLQGFASGYTRWPEAKAVLIRHIPDEALTETMDMVGRFLEDADDDVCIAAMDCLARSEEEAVREKLIQLFFEAESRPRVRGKILDLFQEKEWPVKGYKKRMEQTIELPFYLTAKGLVKRQTS